MTIYFLNICFQEINRKITSFGLKYHFLHTGVREWKGSIELREQKRIPESLPNLRAAPGKDRFRPCP